MKKNSVFIATSLDGYIADKNGNIDWLENIPSIEGNDMGYQEFMNRIDAIIMGRNTFEKVLTFGEWPYENKHVIVLSSKKIIIPGEISETVSASSETPLELYNRLSKEDQKKIYIDGGNTIQRFLQAGLVHELTITIIPILLGSGIPLFAGLKKDIPLKHINTKSYDFGFVQTTYQVVH